MAAGLFWSILSRNRLFRRKSFPPILTPMLPNLLIFLISIVVLAKASTILVDALRSISIRFKLSQFTVGCILMAFATSLPELFVGITSALQNEQILSLGNVLGSNIANITLIIGLPALISRGIRVEGRIADRDLWFMAFAAVTPLILLWDKTLSRLDSVLLLLLYGFYMVRLLMDKEKYPKKIRGRDGRGHLAKDIFKFVVGITLLLGGAEGVVRSARSIAEGLNIPILMIGLFVVAVGTSLPELSFGIPTMLRRQGGMAFGNIIGSVITNSTLVLGLTALINPIRIFHFGIFTATTYYLLLTIFAFVYFVRSQRRLSWSEGLALIFIYIIFLITELTLRTSH